MTGARDQQTGQAGQHFVAAEILRRGGYAVTFAGNMPGLTSSPPNPRKSDHHAVDAQRLEQWRGQWKVLGIFGEV